MTDALRRAVRDGPDAFDPGRPRRRVGAYFLHWRTWINVVTVGVLPFLWAVAPYIFASPPTTEPGSFVELVFQILRYNFGIIPWLLVRPLRLLAALPLVLWLVQWTRVEYPPMSSVWR